MCKRQNCSELLHVQAASCNYGDASKDDWTLHWSVYVGSKDFSPVESTPFSRLQMVLDFELSGFHQANCLVKRNF